MAFAPIEPALKTIAQGGFVVVVDDENRENEGDLILAADCATPEALAFMVRHTSGVVCAALTGERLDALDLPQMTARNGESMRTAFTVTVDARNGVSTGISAADRALTIRKLADPAATAGDFVRPGHIFPLRARNGGVLVRPGHTEAAVDLARSAGRAPAGILCEIVNDDGSMARLPQLAAFAERHGLPLISIADLAAYRRRAEILVRRVSSARLPTRHGDFTAHVYKSLIDGTEHMALTLGRPERAVAPLVRLHSECLSGDVFGSVRCDCGAQLDQALARIAAEGAGVLVYLRDHEGRGIGLSAKIAAYALQDAGRDTVQANRDLGLPVDGRDYLAGGHILRDLGIDRVRLLTNNPAKLTALATLGVSAERAPLPTVPTPHNRRYLATKRDVLGHDINLDRREELAPRSSNPAGPARLTRHNGLTTGLTLPVASGDFG